MEKNQITIYSNILASILIKYACTESISKVERVMRILMVLGLLAVGCGNSAEKKVVGTYEQKEDGDTFRGVFLANGVLELNSA